MEITFDRIRELLEQSEGDLDFFVFLLKEEEQKTFNKEE